MVGVLLDNLVESFGFSTKRARSVSEAQRRPHPFEIEKQGASGPTGHAALTSLPQAQQLRHRDRHDDPRHGIPGELFSNWAHFPEAGGRTPVSAPYSGFRKYESPGDCVLRALCDVYLGYLDLVEDLEHRSSNNSQLLQHLRQFGIVEESLCFGCSVEVANQYYLVLILRVAEDTIVLDPVTVAKCLRALGVVALPERGDVLDLRPTYV